MEKRKVNFEEYGGKYDTAFLPTMKESASAISVETLREQMYGYTFTKDYTEGRIPEEFCMDYWSDLYDNMLFDPEVEQDDIELLADIKGGDKDVDDSTTEYDVWTLQEKLILKVIDSTGDGRTPETALCVIDPHQEYEYINRVSPLFYVEGGKTKCQR